MFMAGMKELNARLLDTVCRFFAPRYVVVPITTHTMVVFGDHSVKLGEDVDARLDLEKVRVYPGRASPTSLERKDVFVLAVAPHVLNSVDQLHRVPRLNPQTAASRAAAPAGSIIKGVVESKLARTMAFSRDRESDGSPIDFQVSCSDSEDIIYV